MGCEIMEFYDVGVALFLGAVVILYVKLEDIHREVGAIKSRDLKGIVFEEIKWHVETLHPTRPHKVVVEVPYPTQQVVVQAWVDEKYKQHYRG